MNNFIQSSLIRIFDDFKYELSQLEDLCCLKTFHYNLANIPDYSIKAVQQLYLLKYLPLYLKEYYNIYHKILSSKFLEYDKIKIAAVGAGCGLDYYGYTLLE